MPWETIQTNLQQFIDRFMGPPSEGFTETWSLGEIIRAESTHFLFSCVVGWLVFSLILTIFSSWKPTWSDQLIFRSGFLFALAASVTTHIFIDGFTNWA